MQKNILLTIILTATIHLSGCCQSDVPTISPQELKTQIDEGMNAIIMDVRRPDEVSRGVISPSILHYDFYDEEFKDYLAELDPESTYYVYCHSGGRSGRTVQMMREMGFENVFNIEGGIMKWQESGFKMVKKE